MRQLIRDELLASTEARISPASRRGGMKSLYDVCLSRHSADSTSHPCYQVDDGIDNRERVAPELSRRKMKR